LPKKQLKKISFHLLDIFWLCRKDDLKKITFGRLLVFCAVWSNLYTMYINENPENA